MPHKKIHYVNFSTRAASAAFYASYGSAWHGNKGMRSESTQRQCESWLAPTLPARYRTAAIKVAAVSVWSYSRAQQLKKQHLLPKPIALRLRTCVSSAVRTTPASLRSYCGYHFVCAHCFYRKVQQVVMRVESVLQPQQKLMALTLPVMSGEELPSRYDLGMLRSYGDRIQILREETPGWHQTLMLPVPMYRTSKQTGGEPKWILAYALFAVMDAGVVPPPMRELHLDCELGPRNSWRVAGGDHASPAGEVIREHLKFPAQLLYTSTPLGQIGYLTGLQPDTRLRTFGFKGTQNE